MLSTPSSIAVPLTTVSDPNTFDRSDDDCDLKDGNRQMPSSKRARHGSTASDNKPR